MTVEQLNPQERRLFIQIAFPLGRGERSLYAEFAHLIVLCIRCCVRTTNTSVNSVDKHSIRYIALLALIFVSTVSTNARFICTVCMHRIR